MSQLPTTVDEYIESFPVSIQAVLRAGLRTADIWSEGTRKVGTREMGDAVVAALTTKTITKS